MFVSVLVLRYDKVELKNLVDILQWKLINYAIKELKNAEYVLVSI